MKLQSRPRELAIIRHAYRNQCNNARRRGIPMKMDIWDFYYLALRPCHYCGKEARPYHDEKTGHWHGVHGLDRTDNNRGYTTGNCVPCCFICNRAKGEMTYDDFIEYCEQVVAGDFVRKTRRMHEESEKYDTRSEYQ